MREKTTIVVAVAFYSRINEKKKPFHKLNYQYEQQERGKTKQKKLHAVCDSCNSSPDGKKAKKISHNLIPQQCKPKHFPATENAILRIYFGSQRMICQFYTIFSHLVAGKKLRDFCVFAPISFAISSICQMELSNPAHEKIFV